MKLLFIAPYVYAPEHQEHSKNRTGFGIMVCDIASSVSKQNNQVTLAVYALGPKRACQDFEIAENRLWQNVLYGHYKGIVRFCLDLRKNGASFKTVLREVYCYLHIGYIRHLIKKEKPDVVHIHGCTSESCELIRTLQDLDIPYVVTLHGLLQDDTAGGTPFQKHREVEIIRKGYAENIPITVISSRMKEMLLSDYYGATQVDNVHIVTNGIPINIPDTTYNVYEKHGIPANKKIILTVGSVCSKKNQKQIIRAFAKMPAQMQEDSVLLLVGTTSAKYSVQEEIEKTGLQNKVICAGFVPREELHHYYAAAYITVTASIVEGFGLSMAEGFVCGAPCVAFADLAAIPDLYDECAMLLCTQRSDEALAEAIRQALNTNWNKDEIIEHSKKFSLEQMAKNYQSVYENVLRS